MSDVTFDYDGSRATARARLEADLPPDQLIPGGLSDLAAAAASAGAIATQLTATRRGLAYIDLREKDWGGEAACWFFNAQDDDLRFFRTAADCFDDAEKALSGYIRELEAGRRTAEHARESYRRGKAAQRAAAKAAADDHPQDHPSPLAPAPNPIFEAGEDPFHLEDAVTTLVSAMHDVFCAAQKAADVLSRAADQAPTKHYLIEHHGPPPTLKTLASIPTDLVVGVFNEAVGVGTGAYSVVKGAGLMSWGKLTGDPDDYYYGLVTMEDGGKEFAKNGALLALDGLGPGELSIVKEMLKAPLDSTLRRTLRDAITQSRPRPAVLPCRDPVDPATGAVFVDQVDVELPGVLPLILRRHYSSDWRHGQWFGRSWASTLDERVDVSERYAAVVLGDGTVLTYPLPEVGGTALPLLGSPWPLERAGDELFRVTDPETGQVRHFARIRPDRFVLIGITEPNGHGVLVVRAPDGTPREVRHTGGYRVRVETDPGIAGGRVTALTVTAEDGTEPVRVAAYAYDGEGRLTGITNSSGVPLEFGYDDAGRVVRWTDRTGVTFDYAYDDRGRCIRQGLRGGGYTARFGYRDLPDGHTETTVADSRGEHSVIVADERGLVVSETDPLGRTTRSGWDDAGRLMSRTDPLGHTTNWLHEERSVTTVRADGAVNRTELELVAGRLLPVRTTQADGTVWTCTYDDRGNCRTVTDPLGAATTADYDDRGHLRAVVDPLGARREVRCDGAGLPVAVTEPGGATTRLERDAFGRVTALVDPLGGRTVLEWTPEGHLAARTLADGSVERWTYDGEGNPVEHLDAAGRRSRFTYTAFDLLASISGADGTVTRLDYDSELRLTRVTSAGGDEWRYVYDGAGQLIAETDYNGRTLCYEYDPAGRLSRRVNGAGEEVCYVRDALGQVVSKRMLSASGETATLFEHDLLGRLTRATSPDADLALDRDPLGRVVSESVNGRGVTSSYDLVGRRTRRVTPAGVVTEWSHRPDGLLASITVAGREIGLEHDAAGRLTRRSLGTTALEQEYDGAGRLLGQRIGNLQERRYAYAPGGRLIGVEDRLGGARRFELDLADRITRVSGDLDLAELYSYDPLGNILRAALPGCGDAERREHTGTLLTRAGRTRYTYDRQGRLVRRVRTRLSRKPETWTYAWDPEDRLTSVRTPDGTTWRYLYDALGRRIAKQRLGDTGEVAEQVLFSWDGPTLVDESATDGTRSWAHDGLAPLAQVEKPSELSQDEVDTRFFAIVTDLVGSPTEMLDETGALLWHAHRSVWGASVGGAPEPVPLRFPGQYADPETGLFYNLHRYYDPHTGRYLSQDPLGLAPAPNPNTYVANPTVLCDPLGLAPCVPVGPAPENVWRILDRVDDKGAPYHGYKGGRIYDNDGRGGTQLLPEMTRDYKRITYKEWDIHPHGKGPNRGTERLVTGSDGSAFYTTDHYDHFIRIR